MPLKALLFDVDGTLADTEPQGHLPSYNDAFAELGLDWNWSAELYRQDLLLLPGGRERIRYFLENFNPPLGNHAAKCAADLDAWVNEVHAVKSRWFRRRLEEGKVTLRPGVARLIREAHASGLILAVVTNASERSLKPFLHYTLGVDLLRKFRFIVSGEQVEHKKPAPDLYLRAVDKLAVDAADCLVIEDSHMGLSAATAAGLKVLVTTNEDTQHHDFSAAQAVVNNLGEPNQPWQVIRGQAELEGQTRATPEALQQLFKAA